MRPHCKNCAKLIDLKSNGYIECEVWGICLGFNNAPECPFYKSEEMIEDENE